MPTPSHVADRWSAFTYPTNGDSRIRQVAADINTDPGGQRRALARTSARTARDRDVIVRILLEPAQLRSGRVMSRADVLQLGADAPPFRRREPPDLKVERRCRLDLGKPEGSHELAASLVSVCG
jgi:hypothetical protein